MSSEISVKAALLNRQIAEAKSGLLYSGLSCVGLLTLGGIITGVTYSMASPGGTYMATTGLFLFGALSGAIAVWRLVQLLFYISKKAASPKPVSTDNHTRPGISRTWKDLD